MERSVHPSARRATRERTSGLSSGIEARRRMPQHPRHRAVPSWAPVTPWTTGHPTLVGRVRALPSRVHDLAPTARLLDAGKPCTRPEAVRSRSHSGFDAQIARGSRYLLGERDVLRREPARGVRDQRHADGRIGDCHVRMMVRGLGEFGDGREQPGARWRNCGSGTRRRAPPSPGRQSSTPDCARNWSAVMVSMLRPCHSGPSPQGASGAAGMSPPAHVGRPRGLPSKRDPRTRRPDRRGLARPGRVDAGALARDHRDGRRDA